MDKCTHDVRRANWLNIINQCQERPANVTVHQWLKDNDIKEKSYYYWLRKFRKESYDQMKLPVTTENPAEISFVEIAAPVTSEKTIQTREFSSASNATAVVRNGKRQTMRQSLKSTPPIMGGVDFNDWRMV